MVQFCYSNFSSWWLLITFEANGGWVNNFPFLVQHRWWIAKPGPPSALPLPSTSAEAAQALVPMLCAWESVVAEDMGLNSRPVVGVGPIEGGHLVSYKRRSWVWDNSMHASSHRQMTDLSWKYSDFFFNICKILFCFYYLKKMYWNIVAWQFCVSLCCTAKWISYMDIYLPSFFWMSFPFRSSQSTE